MKTISILGSTGSIGTQTLDIVRENPGQYEIVALGGNSSVEAIADQAKEFSPQVVAISDEENAKKLSELLPAGVEILTGPTALAEASILSDITVNAVVGFAGLPITIETLKAGKRLALANKESLVAAVPLVNKIRAGQIDGAEIIPIDSEHCAIHQCLRSSDFKMDQVKSIILTASGGPFRGRSKEELTEVTLQEALNHPTWNMGPKVTVDSSTLMNKGLEVIEATALFGVSYDQIKVIVHPQSIVHSMVEYIDGATIAQLSMPDMRLCIGYALAFPERLNTPFGEINWSEMKHLDFEMPDIEAFPALQLAYEAGKRGNTAPAVLNASNEVANAAFLAEKISWSNIVEIVEKTLNLHGEVPADDIDAIIEEDKLARKTAEKLVEEKASVGV